jgi:hypothetical protein
VTASTRSRQTTNLRPAPVGRPEPDFVAFWTAGARAIGSFSCAACGRSVHSVRQLPDCPNCGGTLWELPATSPFPETAGVPSRELDDWHREDLESTAGFLRGVVIALVLAPLCWLLPLGIGIGLYVLLRG